jgi:hypothetical protein
MTRPEDLIASAAELTLNADLDYRQAQELLARVRAARAAASCLVKAAGTIRALQAPVVECDTMGDPQQ